MSFPRYPAYKDSGVEWIGEIPVGWNLERVKCSVLECKNGVWGHEPQFDNDDITCVRVADFDREKLIISPLSLTVRNIKQEDIIGREVLFGDLLIEKSGGGEKQPVGCVVFYSLNHKSVCSNFIARMKISNSFVNKYLLYVHKFLYNSGVTVRSIKQTSGIQNLDQNSYLNEKIPVPPHPEQQAIANFLDRECGKIDALIAEQERLIALLAEKRQAVISHAVTKGLNPNAPMKDSGIPWIGMVPEGWEVVTAGRVVRVISGFAFPSDKFLKYGEGVPLLRGVNVGVGKLRWDDVVYWKRQIDDGLDIYELKEGDIVIGMDRPWISSGLRISKIYKKDLPCLLLQRVGLLRLKKYLNSSFLMYQYSLPNFMHFLAPEMTGVSVPHISPSQIASFPICLPSRKIQDEIVTYLARAITEFESLILTATNAITLLKERRAALISAAVTGKIDVRAQNKALAA